MKEKILKLRAEGKTYDEIAEELDCSKGTVAYHCGIGQKEKAYDRVQNTRKRNPLLKKIYAFVYNDRRRKRADIGLRDASYLEYFEVLNKDHSCYLTGEQIDVKDTSSYEIDHVTPLSRGGTVSISNARIASKYANRAKSDLLEEEFIDLCKKVLTHHGYTVSKN